MACFSPISITLEDGVYNPVTRAMDMSIPVPCGKCEDCYRRRIKEWAFRMWQELKHSKSCHFVTLTYDDFHLEYDIGGTGRPTVKKSTARAFIKRLRNLHKRRIDPTLNEVIRTSRRLNRSPKRNEIDMTMDGMKYYIVGEYGNPENTERPHYHAIIWNSDPSLIRKAWDKGNVDIRTLTEFDSEGALYYVADYMHKTFHEDGYPGEPSFSLKSRWIGYDYIAEDYITLYSKTDIGFVPTTRKVLKWSKEAKWHREHYRERCWVSRQDGDKIPMPKFYKDILYDKKMKNDIRAYIHGEMMKKDKELVHKYGIDGWTPEYVKHKKIITLGNIRERKELRHGY